MRATPGTSRAAFVTMVERTWGAIRTTPNASFAMSFPFSVSLFRFARPLDRGFLLANRKESGSGHFSCQTGTTQAGETGSLLCSHCRTCVEGCQVFAAIDARSIPFLDSLFRLYGPTGGGFGLLFCFRNQSGPSRARNWPLW